MEKLTKPENLFIARKKWLNALAALVFLAFGAVIAIVLPLGLVKRPPDDLSTMILLCIGSAVLAAYSLLLAALNMRNLFFPYILTSDEKGIYNYSGLLHFGFIKWEDIASIGQDSTIMDVLDNDSPHLTIFVNDLKEYKRALTLGKRQLLFWSGGNIKVYTLCSQIKRKQLGELLENSLRYYKQSYDTTVDNG